jgi:ATP-dependent helicase HrpB
VAYRLWEEAGHPGRPEFAPPEIEVADLTGLVLALARWGSSDAGALQWLDPPPAASLAAARAALERLGAMDNAGRIAPLGQAMARMPMAPSEAAALLHASDAGVLEETAQLVLLMQERGLGGRSEDLAIRLRGWRADRSPRATSARRIAEGWARKAAGERVAGSARTAAVQSPAGALALARRDFVARRRDAGGEDWLSVGGRGYRLDPAAPLAGSEWIVICDAQGAAKGARITAGIALDAAEVEALFENELQEIALVRWNPEKCRVECRRERRLGAIRLASGPDPSPDPSLVVDILVDKALEDLGKLFAPGFLARAEFAGIEPLSLANLKETAAIWLAPLLEDRRDLALPPHKVAEAALASLADWNTRQALERAAPSHFVSPADTRHPIDYAGEDAPSVEVRVQALFGLDDHPMIGRTPLLIKLTSPAGRPLQSTRDLPGFWRGSWADVVKEMKGRYPKHRWPEQPWLERPSLKTKNAFNRG